MRGKQHKKNRAPWKRPADFTEQLFLTENDPINY